MATQAIEQAPEASPAADPPKRKGLVVVLATAGILGGAAVGLLVVAPMFAKRQSSAQASEKKAAASAAVIHEIQSLVLNPAGTDGRRFLMVTAALQLKDASTDDVFKEHEAEIKDRILSLLGKKTVEELSDPARRDGIKAEVIQTVAPLFPKGSITKVFFPQFVIQ